MQQESGQAAMANGGIDTAEVPADAGDQPTDVATASAAVAVAAAAVPETTEAIESGHDSDGERTDHHDGDGESSGSEGDATTKTRSWAEETERAFRQPRAHRRRLKKKKTATTASETETTTTMHDATEGRRHSRSRIPTSRRKVQERDGNTTQ